MISGFCILCLAVVGFVVDHKVHAQSPMIVTGIPEQGLMLIGPTSADFQQMADNVLQGRTDYVFEQLRPYSVILQNTTQKIIVGYALRWEYLGPNGKRIPVDKTIGQVKALRDGLFPKSKSTYGMTAVIAPGSWRIVTPQSVVGSDTAVTSPALIANPEFVKFMAYKADKLQNAQNLTVSLDGVFFDDGTFVGPDRSAFFEVFQWELEAKQHLLEHILRAVRAGQDPDTVAAQIENSLPKIPPQTTMPTDSNASTAFKNFFTYRYAAEFLRIYRGSGREPALGWAYQNIFHHPPQLRKIEQSGGNQ